jgi:hypothetical protein
VIAATALGLLLAGPAGAAAQPAKKKKKLTRAQKRKAARYTRAGNKLKRQGDAFKRRKKAKKAKAKYKRAVIAYSKAFAINGSTALIFKLAGVYWARGELKWARRGFKRYIELAPDGRYADKAVRAVKMLSDKIEQEEMVGPLDDGEISLEPTAVFGPAEKKPEPKPEPEPEPEKIEKPKPKKVVVKPKKKKKKRRPPQPGRTLRWAGIGTSAAGLLAVAIGIKFGADASSAADDLSGNQDAWTDADRKRISEGESANRKFIAFTLIGTAAVIGGGVLYVMGQRAARKGTRRDRVTVTPTADQDSVGLVVWGRF